MQLIATRSPEVLQKQNNRQKEQQKTEELKKKNKNQHSYMLIFCVTFLTCFVQKATTKLKSNAELSSAQLHYIG